MAIPAVHPDTDSGDSTTNISREDLLMPPLSFDKLSEPPPFDSLRARDTRPGTSSSLSPSSTRLETLLPSSSGSSTSLPGYSASLPVPDYHPDPTGDEQRLEFVPTRSIYGRPSGVWTKRIKDITITLHNQDPIEVQRTPRYGRTDIIKGTIEFDEDNLPAFEKVKLIVRSLLICAGTASPLADC